MSKRKGTIVKMSNGINLINAMGQKIVVVDAGAKATKDQMKAITVNREIRDLIMKGIERDSVQSSAGNLVSITILPHFKKMITTITKKFKDTYIVAEPDIAMAVGAPFVSLSVLDQDTQIYSLETVLVINK